jgi:methyl-accepting chemotaxis protein
MIKFLQRVLTATLVLTAGCFSFHSKPNDSASTTGPIRRTNGTRAGRISGAVLTGEVGRFADEYTVLVAQAADTFAAQVGTPQSRVIALGWKTSVANATMIIATGINPTANLLDMVVLVTLQRMTFEEYWVPKYGQPAEAMLAVSRELEGEIWAVADGVLTTQQESELRELIREWREKHPEQIYVTVRFRDFAELASVALGGGNAKPGSLFSLPFLDPFSGLDPTTRELAQTRFFGERALYVLERMPKLLRWQSELVVAQSLAAPEVLQLVSNSTSFARSAEQLTQAVQKFPEQVAAEREQIMKGLSSQVPEWQALSAQFQQTFQSGNEMARSVDAAVNSLDSFIKRVSHPPATGGADTNHTATTGKSFDVTEYGAAAAEIGKAAQQLDTLTHSLEQTTPEIGTVVERTGIQGKELVDYTFRKALWFLLLALAGLVVALLAYRWGTARLMRNSKGNQP